MGKLTFNQVLIAAGGVKEIQVHLVTRTVEPVRFSTIRVYTSLENSENAVLLAHLSTVVSQVLIAAGGVNEILSRSLSFSSHVRMYLSISLSLYIYIYTYIHIYVLIYIYI